MAISVWGVLVGLLLAIFLIFKKTAAAYAMMLGALAAGLVGLMGYWGQPIPDIEGEKLGFFNLLNETVRIMMLGAGSVITVVLRILAAGVLAGILIMSNGAKAIAKQLVRWFGQTRALMAITVTVAILTMAGVFIDVAVITVAPIALSLASQLRIKLPIVLLAMIGGGKAGNIVSANPNAIALAGIMDIPLPHLMLAGVIPALFGIVLTIWIVARLDRREAQAADEQAITEEEVDEQLPNVWLALSGPLLAIVLLALRPLLGVNIDPLIALPVGALVSLALMRKWSHVQEYVNYGLQKMSGVAILLIGTGTLAGVIGASELSMLLRNLLETTGLPLFLLAPFSGILMSAATASTTVGATLAGNLFGSTLQAGGVGSISTAAMMHSGATVLDHLPHGSFFHATAGSVGLDFKARLKLIPYESLIGLVMTLISTLIFGIIINI